MTTFASNVAFGGARGSNAGDQFHELWALQQTLDLLTVATDLKAVGVEGVRTEAASAQGDSPTWDGVDCALYYGGNTLETADRIEFVQLKYSAANPEIAWSVSRLVASNSKTGSNAVIRKMANDFIAAKARVKAGAAVRIRLISNQGVSARLIAVLAARWSESLENGAIDEAIVADLKLLHKTTGLSPTEFNEFLDVLDFSECGSDSSFSTKQKVIAAVASVLGDDVLPEVRELQIKIRELMLPARAREVVTERDVLLWFGLSGREGLFPCLQDIRQPRHTVMRSAGAEVVELLKKGERILLVHGVGGCGKTTLTRQIAERLPKGSQTVLFDCYGGGRYTYSDDKRHLPENAFLHLANEIAIALRLPLFIPRNFKNPATIRSFLAKLRSAGNVLTQLSQEALLLVIIDAADNSVSAAEGADPPERPFVFDLFDANLAALPRNVRFVVSCRTGRKASLRLPEPIAEVVCPPFTIEETRQHLEGAFEDSSASLVSQFHSLSNANPRVQSYAIVAADGDRSRALEALLPGGRTLPDVLKATFNNALIKIGRPQLFEKLVGVLALLPAPVSTDAISRIAGCTLDTVRDFALDLAPGLRLRDDAITVADEDFEAFIKSNASTNQKETLAHISDDFLANFQTDSYCSTHIAEILVASGRKRDLLSIIERDPQVVAIGDPVVRRQVQIRRLKKSLAACREAGSTVDALKTALISAEAERDDSTLNEVLEKELDLSVEFGGPSLRRTILLDPERIQRHGSFLARDALRAIRTGDQETAREQLLFYEAWLKRRRSVPEDDLKSWKITDYDISARVETILRLDGPSAAMGDLLRWRPRTIPVRVACILVPELIAAGRVDEVRSFLRDGRSAKPWNLLLWIPLAMAGEKVDGQEIEKSLGSLDRRFIPDPTDFSYSDDGPWRHTLLDTFIIACELAFKMALDSDTILSALQKLLGVLEGKGNRRLHSSSSHRIDGLFRCWLLKQEICGANSDAATFIAYIESLNPTPVPPKRARVRKPGKSTRRKKPTVAAAVDSQQDDELHRKLKALLPLYLGRARILALARSGDEIEGKHLEELGRATSAYELNYDFDSMQLRGTAARSIMALLVVDSVQAAQFVKYASALAQGRSDDISAIHRRAIWSKLRLRVSEANGLLQLVATTVAAIKGLRAASSDKLGSIVHLSRLILPISRDDAQSLFNDAVGIAKEIDQEAIDQIDFVSVLAERASVPAGYDRRAIAADIFMFVSGAAERLADQDGFPWEAAANALTCLDECTALAAASRWADQGTVRLEGTLDRVLETALRRDTMSPAAAISLALLVGGANGALLDLLSARTAGAPKKYREVLEELAKQVLLLSTQDARLLRGKAIADQLPKDEFYGPWFRQLKETTTFLSEPLEESAPPSQYKRTESFNGLPEEFQFSIQGKTFQTPQSISEILEAAKSSGLRHSARDLIRRMRDASAAPRDRVGFLNALNAIPDEAIWSTDRVEMIRDSIDAWKGTPAVDHWCRNTLPSVLITHFYGATRYLNERRSTFRHLLECTGVDASGRLSIMLSGIAHAGETLSSRTLFSVAREVARELDGDDAGVQLVWYTQRLRDRLTLEEQSLHGLTGVPVEGAEAIARLLFSLMGDIDVRIRWKAAHALRGLARLGCVDVVDAIVRSSDRDRDDAFRDPTAPFYFLASKLWLTISLYRISAETPAALASSKMQLLELATSPSLPHVGIQEYAKRTLLQLDSAGVIVLAPLERAAAQLVNTARKGKVAEKAGGHRSFERNRERKPRFKFDEMDTIPSWYRDILRIFPTVSEDDVLEIASQWIVDKWKADPEANWWDKEPRKARYQERQFELWSHRHGSLPTVERYGTYLEWNAMHCVVGELLATHPILESDEYYSNFDDWLRNVLVTAPPTWLADNRGPTPLEARLWREDSRTDRGWCLNIRRSEFLTEIGVNSPIREGWLVIAARYSVHFPKRETNVRIGSALASPETSPALLRALQTASSPWDYRIPDEDDDLQIDVSPYRLVGWLANSRGDRRFDERDPFRYEVGQIQVSPGRKLVKSFGLVTSVGSPMAWRREDTHEVDVVYEAWCDEPEKKEDYRRTIRSEGWRLWARSEMVQSFLKKRKWDLIFKVQVERQLHSEYRRSYEADAKSKAHTKIFLLGSNGIITDIKGNAGTWAGTGRGAGTRPRC